MTDERKRLSTQLLHTYYCKLLRIVTSLCFSYSSIYIYNNRMFVQYTVCVLNYDIQISVKIDRLFLSFKQFFFLSSLKSSYIIDDKIFHFEYINIVNNVNLKLLLLYKYSQISTIENYFFYPISMIA